MITTVTEALAAAAEILAPYGDEVHYGLTEYRQQNGAMVQMVIGVHAGDMCRLVGVYQYEDPIVTWEAALDKLRATHATVVAEMRAEIAAKAGETGSVR